MAARRVLSVQSHVVHGYVGNRAAVFPLQLLGFEVDVINSVQFSCHTGYPAIKGQKLSGDDLRTLVDGLQANGVLDHGHLLTGYIGSASFLREVVRLRGLLPSGSRYICDPVLGDNGKLYAPEELIEIYRDEVLPHATVLLPNQFEAELLTGGKIRSLAEACAACDALHARGPRTVIMTSLDALEGEEAQSEFLTVLLSEAGRLKWQLQAPLVGGHFTGTGDLTAAMILAWTQIHGGEAPAALEKTCAVLQAVIRHTAQTEARVVGGKRVPPELRILDCKRAIESPEVVIRSRLVQPLNIAGVVLATPQASEPADWMPGFRLAAASLAAKGVRLGLAARGRGGDEQLLRDDTQELFSLVVPCPEGADMAAGVQSFCEAWSLGPDALLFMAAAEQERELREAGAAGARTAALFKADSDPGLAAMADFAMSFSFDGLLRLFP